MKNRKAIILTVFFELLLSGIASAIYLFLYKKPIVNSPTNNQQVVSQQVVLHGACLKRNEVAEYELESKTGGDALAKITIKNKDTQEKISEIQIDRIISATHYHPIEIHNCGIYVIRSLNYDPTTRKPLAGYNSKIWKYDYSENTNSLVILDQDPIGNLIGYKSFYNSDFRVDPLEKYLVLQKGYLGSSGYAIVIKNLSTLEDIFTLPLSDIEKKNPDITGDVIFVGGGWSRDGRYFWFDTHEGANTLAFIRIDSTDWSYKILPVPKDVLGGDALNLENGYITVHPGNVWFGIAELTQEEQAKRRAQGIGTELYIQNLITNDRRLVATTTEPLWYFKPVWLSDTELQYTLSSGEKNIYILGN